MRRFDVRSSLPLRFVVLRSAVPRGASALSLPQGPNADLGPGVRRSGLPYRIMHVETTGPPKFLENPLVPMPCSSTPAGPDASGHTMHRHGPRTGTTARTPAMKIFRGSIARPRHSLSTLRPPGRPGRTQDSLPAVGQLYGTGLLTRRVPTKGFTNDSYIRFSFPKLRLAQDSSSLFG